MSSKWIHPKPLNRPDETITQGETFSPTDAELSAFGDQISSVNIEEDTATESGDTSTAPYDPSEFTIKELRTELSDLSDSQREALVAAEREGKNRDTAVEVLAP